MTHMVADQLVRLWEQVDANKITWDQFEQQKCAWLDNYATCWRRALLMDGATDLRDSSLGELMRYLDLKDLSELESWRDQADRALQGSWQAVDPHDPGAVERFYDSCDLELYNLLAWHTLSEDDSPLAYVAAMEFAKPHQFKSYLDFGSGVGSGGILFARHGYDVTLADVSSPLLRFSRWRHAQRGLTVNCIDLKTDSLPTNRLDFITAMDVFEHLVDPVATAEQVCAALRPGGILFGRFHADPQDTHVTHIVKDFAPMFARMRELGVNPLWRDRWLWGHQAFQKALPE